MNSLSKTFATYLKTGPPLWGKNIIEISRNYRYVHLLKNIVSFFIFGLVKTKSSALFQETDHVNINNKVLIPWIIGFFFFKSNWNCKNCNNPGGSYKVIHCVRASVQNICGTVFIHIAMGSLSLAQSYLARVDMMLFKCSKVVCVMSPCVDANLSRARKIPPSFAPATRRGL